MFISLLLKILYILLFSKQQTSRYSFSYYEFFNRNLSFHWKNSSQILCITSSKYLPTLNYPFIVFLKRDSIVVPKLTSNCGRLELQKYCLSLPRLFYDDTTTQISTRESATYAMRLRGKKEQNGIISFLWKPCRRR